MTHRYKKTVGLELDEAEMRILGYRVVDMIVEHLGNLRQKSATGYASRESLERVLREPPPAKGCDYSEVLDLLEDQVFPYAMWSTHPRHFAWVPGPSNFVGVMADALASGYNLCPTSWLEGSGPSQIELIAVDWLRLWCGFPESAGGIFVSGGSMANLTAMAIARRVKLNDRIEDARVYCSTQIHSSIMRDLRVLGFHRHQIRQIDVDENLQMSLTDLREVIAHDEASGLRPFCVVGTAGTTNAGTVDPLDALADLCQSKNLWFHIDGAYGAAAVLTPTGRRLLSGMHRADSLAIDPHKWLFQPFEIGCCLVRDERWLPLTFSERPEYLQDTWADLDEDQEVNFGERGVQLTRGFRALKLWMTVKVFGEEALRGAIQVGIDNAHLAQSILRELRCFEIVTQAQLGVLTFRFTPPIGTQVDLDQLTKAIYDENRARGHSMLTTTVIRGQTVLRLCTINPRTTEDDLRSSMCLLAELGHDICASMRV